MVARSSERREPGRVRVSAINNRTELVPMSIAATYHFARLFRFSISSTFG